VALDSCSRYTRFESWSNHQPSLTEAFRCFIQPAEENTTTVPRLWHDSFQMTASLYNQSTWKKQTRDTIFNNSNSHLFVSDLLTRQSAARTTQRQ
jgi:hypothetical protein